MRTKITFPPNVTQIVDLFDPAVLVQGQFGDQWQYFLHSDKVMWIDPIVHEQILALGATSGDSIGITKRVTPSPTGGRAKTAWTVERVEDEPAHTAPTPAPAPAPKPPQPAAAMAAAIDDEEAGRWPEPAAPRRAPQPISAPAPAAPLAPLPYVPDNRAPMPAQQPGTDADALLSALTTAIDVAAIAAAHASRRGFPLHFDGADIRALASGLMIERRDRSGSTRRAA